MKALLFNQLGEPAEVLRLVDQPAPALGANDVLVKMSASSIGPGDALYTQGLYPEPKRPVFPNQIAGNHGVGVIAQTGSDAALAVGTLVAFSHSSLWAEYVALPEDALIPLPDGYPIDKAAQVANLITAWDLLSMAAVEKGDWLVLTAGGSSVATMLLQFAVQQGINVISIVREPELYQQDLLRLGAKAVLSYKGDEDIATQIKALTEEVGVKGVIDCVGGSLLSRLIKTFAYGAHAVIYGAFDRDNIELHNYDLLLNCASLSAYNYRLLSRSPRQDEQAGLAELFEVAGRPEFEVLTAKSFSLAEYKEAFEAALGRGSSQVKGKYLFKMD